jgi:outer membrane lipoprotein carrier protein
MTLCQRLLDFSARTLLSAVCILILAGFTGTAAGSDESPVDIGIRLQARYNRIKSLTFDFNQQTSGQLTGRGGRGNGKAYFLKTGKKSKML